MKDNIELIFDNFFQSYHTGIETSLGNNRCKNKDELSIVPYWNWNNGLFEKDKKSEALSIVPYWNWNDLKNKIILFRITLSIVPYWNWNTFFSDMCKRWYFFQSYHTGIETSNKSTYLTHIETFQSYHTGIETQQEIPAFRWSDPFQSYHTGIETCCWISCEKPTVSFNRTILELKLNN